MKFPTENFLSQPEQVLGARGVMLGLNVSRQARRVANALACALALFAVGAFAQPGAAPTASPASAAPASAAKPAPAPVTGEFVPDRDYRIGPEDLLDITVWREDAMKQQALVRPDGGISFPLIGEVLAAGKTVDELRDEIAKRLEKFLPSPVVNLSIVKVGSHRIYVIGRVTRPGDFPAGRYIDVLQVLTMAGGLTPFASENSIQIIRREDGKQTIIPFKYGEVRRGINMGQNLILRAGDTVVVP